MDYTELHGYQDGKLRAKYITKLVHHRLPDGSNGLMLTSEFKFSVGTRSRVNSTTKVIMKDDYTFVSSDRVRVENDDRTEVNMVRSGDVVKVVKKDKNGSKEESSPVTGPAYAEVHPLLYAKELTKAGEKKAYPIFYEPIRIIVPMTIKNMGLVTISEGEETISCIRYGIKSLATSKGYDDYFVEKDTHRLVRINTPDMQFSLPK